MEVPLINNNTVITLDVVFSIFRGFTFTKTMAEVQRSYAHALSLSCHSTQHAGNTFGLLPQGNCERDTLNLEKTTSNVLTVMLLIYGRFPRNQKECRQIVFIIRTKQRKYN